jgi:23S rRNA (uracil1939-C5)-methyltransferase
MGPFKQGEETEVTVSALANEGWAVGRVDGFVVLVDRGIPGQRLRVRIDACKRRYAQATALEVLEPSEHQIDPPCRHFGECGGCLWQDLEYSEQLAWKGRFVSDSLTRLAKIQGIEPAAVVPSPQTFRCRNKMEYAFEGGMFSGQGDGLRLGLRRRGSHQVIDIHDCLLQSEQASALVNEVRRLCSLSGVPAYDPRSKAGLWRYLVVRESERTGQRLVHFITAPAGAHGPAVRAVAEGLLAAFPETHTVVHSERRDPVPVAKGERVCWALKGESRGESGDDSIHEELGGLRFRVSAEAFFQPNTGAAEQLYAIVAECAGLRGDETVWDLYCGCGGISLYLAAHTAETGVKVIGIDSSRPAIRDAEANAQQNSLADCTFLAGDVAKVLGRLQEQPDVVVLDPPRAGMRPEVARVLLDVAPRRIVYVSCNPATQARDLAALLPGYTVESVRPVDQFPHTPHVENVVLLKRRG